MNNPIPPSQHYKHSGHHWLEIIDYDKRSFGYIVLQWSPVQKKWYHSNEGGTVSNSVNTNGWRYVKHIPLPESA